MKRLKFLGLFLASLGILFLACSFFVPFNRFLPAWKHWDGTYTIEAGESKGPSIGLFWGTVVEGMLVVSGGNNDVYFSIEDSQGGTVLPKTVASNTYFFGPTQVSRNAYYRFVFDNSMSFFTSKSVYWIVRAYWYSLTFLILGSLSLALGIIATLYERIKTPKLQKEEKPETALPEPQVIEVVRKHCPNCRALNDEEAKFCVKCGTSFIEKTVERLEKEVEKPRLVPSKTMGYAVLLICCIIGAPLIVLGFVCYVYETPIQILFTVVYVHPYREYAAPLWAVGTIVVVLGLLYTVMLKQ